MKRALVIPVLGAPFVLGACSGDDAEAAAASTPSPSTTAAIARTDPVRGLVNGGGDITVKDGMDTVTYQVTAQPGASTGWHKHPGPGFFIVTKGVLTDYGLDGAACEPVQIKAGEAHFVPAHPHHPHLARNETEGITEATIIYMNVPAGQPFTAPAEPPGECPDDLR